MFDQPMNRQLAPDQEQVIAAIIGGATLQAAADAAGVHRNTVGYWRRTSLRFRESLTHALYEKAIGIREQAEPHVADAWSAIHAILNDPKASSSVRLNAAKFIIEKASTPPPPEAGAVYRMETIAITHKNAQTDPPAHAQTDPQTHKDAQSPAPQVGRNTPCPCGSGVKFKRCCLGKPNLATAA
jgi:transposase-like protein